MSLAIFILAGSHVSKILVAENYPGSHLGALRAALEAAGVEIDERFMHEGADLPASPDGYAGIIVLGGAQNALADDEHPYLPHLVRLTRAFGDEGKAVLGICLGSQIIARAYGGRNVVGGRPLEIGWQNVWPTDAGRADPVVSTLGDAAPMFHWHFDTFDLPEGAVHLASSALTPNQAFRVGDKVYALQFHFEADTQLVGEWVEGFGDHLNRVAPEWFATYPEALAAHAPRADAVGAAIARAWVALAHQSPSAA